MVTTKPIYVAAYYRPKEGDTESIAELRRSLDTAAQLKSRKSKLKTQDKQANTPKNSII